MGVDDTRLEVGPKLQFFPCFPSSDFGNVRQLASNMTKGTQFCPHFVHNFIQVAVIKVSISWKSLVSVESEKSWLLAVDYQNVRLGHFLIRDFYLLSYSWTDGNNPHDFWSLIMNLSNKVGKDIWN